ncbi:MAG TPA: histidine phosphatase family protein [Ignavibacteriaceae bacterium]|nr:histidine phosphatase family protein [Ignavibacteriaceae bacterium]
MKNLFLVRHAKSSWKYNKLTDLERPLSGRGKRDALFMGKLLSKQKIKPEIIICSPANRALSTAKYFCEEMDCPFDGVKIEPGLYMADSEELMEIIANAESDIKTVMIFSHNPGITDLYNHLSDEYIENIPTCGIAGIQFTEDSWKDLKNKKGHLLFFEYPKKYFSNKKP